MGTKCKGRIARIEERSTCGEIGVNEYVGWRQWWRFLTGRTNCQISYILGGKVMSDSNSDDI